MFAVPFTPAPTFRRMNSMMIFAVMAIALPVLVIVNRRKRK